VRQHRAEPHIARLDQPNHLIHFRKRKRFNNGTCQLIAHTLSLTARNTTSWHILRCWPRYVTCRPEWLRLRTDPMQRCELKHPPMPVRGSDVASNDLLVVVRQEERGSLNRHRVWRASQHTERTVAVAAETKAKRSESETIISRIWVHRSRVRFAWYLPPQD
jgi:hypothetical protein